MRTLKQLSQKKSSTFTSVHSANQQARESQMLAKLKLKPESPPTPMNDAQNAAAAAANNSSPSRDPMGSTANRIVIVHKQSGMRDSMAYPLPNNKKNVD